MTKDSAFAKAMTDKATTKTLRPEARGQLLEANGSAYAKASADKAKDQRPKTKKPTSPPT
jgi:hypothetical protein